MTYEAFKLALIVLGIQRSTDNIYYTMEEYITKSKNNNVIRIHLYNDSVCITRFNGEENYINEPRAKLFESFQPAFNSLIKYLEN